MIIGIRGRDGFTIHQQLMQMSVDKSEGAPQRRAT